MRGGLLESLEVDRHPTHHFHDEYDDGDQSEQRGGGVHCDAFRLNFRVSLDPPEALLLDGCQERILESDPAE